MERCALQLGRVNDADFHPVIYWHEDDLRSAGNEFNRARKINSHWFANHEIFGISEAQEVRAALPIGRGSAP